ncbi:MAG: helix-turn-helix transcriptional regulator, partial [Desulfocapsaceae bacterium]|nr:helix-turn-helix transcriptional regulator [Desulfocapsaceae bacterium]
MENSETAIAIENKQRQAFFIAGLAETIRAQKIAQKDLAVKAQISAVTLSKVLNGKQGCSQEWRNKVSKPLNITEEELVKKGAVITAATHPAMQGEAPVSEKLVAGVLPENVSETTEQGRALPIEEIFQILRDKFYDTEAEAKEAKAHMIRCYEVFEALHDSITIVSSDHKIMYQNHASILFLGK